MFSSLTSSNALESYDTLIRKGNISLKKPEIIDNLTI